MEESKLSGMIKPVLRVVKLADGLDHENWIEVGESEVRGFKVCIVSYAPNFGWLWKSGWMTEEELQKAAKGEKFQWLNSGIAGHGIP